MISFPQDLLAIAVSISCKRLLSTPWESGVARSQLCVGQGPGRELLTAIVDENGIILSDNIVTTGIDDIKIPVTSELQQYRNKPVRLRFGLENAQLYGFEIND